MKQSPSSRRGRASKEVQKLMDLAEGISQSGSRAEDRFWNTKLETGSIKFSVTSLDQFDTLLEKLGVHVR